MPTRNMKGSNDVPFTRVACAYPCPLPSRRRPSLLEPGLAQQKGREPRGHHVEVVEEREERHSQVSTCKKRLRSLPPSAPHTRGERAQRGPCPRSALAARSMSLRRGKDGEGRKCVSTVTRYRKHCYDHEEQAIDWTCLMCLTTPLVGEGRERRGIGRTNAATKAADCAVKPTSSCGSGGRQRHEG